MEKTKVCPFGTKARHCQYQETYAKDPPSAMQGELAFFCTFNELEEYPKLKEVLNDRHKS